MDSINLKGQQLDLVTDCEQDLAAVLKQLRSPSLNMHRYTKRLIDAIRSNEAEVDVCKVLNYIADAAIDNTKLITRNPPHSKFNPATSVIHKQLTQLIKSRKKFNLMLADPPWEYQDKADAGERGASHKYKTMRLKDILEMGDLVHQVMEDDSIIMLWGTWPLLQEAKRTLRRWGFKYKTCGFVWVKLNQKAGTTFVGGGHYTRSNSEYVLIGIRGRGIKRFSAGVRQVIHSVPREHSRKPEEFYEAVLELYGLNRKNSPVRCIELFGRQQRDFITVLGDQRTKFN